MRKIQTVLICAAYLFFVTSAVTAQKAKKAMTNADVIQMAGAALSEQIIITSIRQARAKNFDLTPTGLIALKKAGVSDSVILVMQEVSAPTKSTSTGGDKMPADEKESIVNAYLRQRVASESGSALLLASFRKTNGYEQGVTGLYTLEWQADISVQQDIWKAGNVFVGYFENFHVMAEKPGPLESIGMSPKRFNKETIISLKGESTFRKTEQGWRLEGLSVKGAQVTTEPKVEPDKRNSTPTLAYKALYEAVKKKDPEAIKKTLSKGTLDMMKTYAEMQKKTLNEVLQNGLTETTFSPSLPQTRNEKIWGDVAILEVKNEKTGAWDALPFVREEGTWKLAIDTFFKGTMTTNGPTNLDNPGQLP